MVSETEPGNGPDVVEELKRLGRQLGETFDAAWSSEERKKAEEEIRTGARLFAEEFGRALGRARTARPGEVAWKARRSTADGLRWLSGELESLAERFTPAEGDERHPRAEEPEP